MKNILIPTDFSIKSLSLVKKAIERYKGAPLNIILCHAVLPDDSISGLLLFQRRNRHYDKINMEFREACEILRNKYASHIRSLRVHFIYGSGAAMFRNHLEGLKIDVIIVPSAYKLKLPLKESMDMTAMIRRSGYPVETISLKNALTPQVAESTLSDLLTV